MNSKIENIFFSVKTCHYKIMEKSEDHYGSHKKEEKVRPGCSICILHVLNSLFPDLFAKQIVEIKFFLYKNQF